MTRRVAAVVFICEGDGPIVPVRAASQDRAPAETWRHVIDAQHVTPAALPLVDP